MPKLSDIPAVWYLKFAIWIARLFRKSKQHFFKRIVANFRNRAILGPMIKLHLEAIHDIRKFALNRDNLSDDSATYDSLEHLANSCRNVMADILEAWQDDIHCTIKICQGQKSIPKRRWKVFTIARSTPCSRPAEFGLENAHFIKNNSSFAALTGINDRKNTWYPNVYSCFVCNDLTKHDKYDCSRKDWSSYFKSTIVFPLRYRKAKDRNHNIIGFLTFDTLDETLLKGMPCIFHKWSQKSEYEKQLSFQSFFHMGGLLSDTLACAFYPLLMKEN